MSTDVADWLRRLGLEQYEPAFADNNIDGEVLAQLTADDLIGLGVTSIGHRRKLLGAIAQLRAAAPSTSGDDPFVDINLTAGREPVRPSGSAERRQLTVMFCDLVGSTALAARFDPEDLREVIGTYHRCVVETVARFEGFVAKYMGDGVLVYFGYPQAHEDDAERAVRAGLAVIDAVRHLELAERLQARLGIASGLVVVGDLIGVGAARERGVVGETPNLAARLQALAEPNRLVIADATRRQIGGLFDVEALGPRPLAGFAEPQRCWRVVDESGVISRFEALRSGTTPLIGRDEELDLLLRRWQQMKAGEGRAVLLSGEPGIGKSRLTVALSERIGDEPHTRLRYFCSPHHQDSALYPFTVQLERAAGFARDDTAEQKMKKLEALLASGLRGRDEFALLAELLSLPNSATELNLSPRRKREALFEALLRQLQAVARSAPVLMVFEDAHWIDPTSRELIDLILDRVPRMPVLLVVTFRPEFQHSWGGTPHVTMLALNRLGGREGAALVEKLAGNLPLSDEIVHEIVERTDGVPLFVEELTKAVLESAGQEHRVGAVLASSPAPSLAIPATLQASLTSRLDRLGTAAKEVAQIGAVLGREFAYELIQRVAQRSDSDLQAALGQLTDAGLLFCRGIAPQSSYLFKHALVQDAAYGTLLRGRRQELHARAGAALQQHFGELIERQPELLAHHFTAAGAAQQAAAQWLKAGQRAATRSAHPEAIGHFGRGLAIVASLPESPERDRQEVELQLAKGLSLLTAEGFTSTAAVEAYACARALCERGGDADHLFVALWNLWMTTAVRNPATSRPLSSRLLALTKTQEDSALRLEALHSAWFTRFSIGEPGPARSHCDEGRRLYNFERHRSLALSYGGHDPGVCACHHGGFSEWLLGYPDKALASVNEAVRLGERLAHPFSLFNGYLWEAVLHTFRGESDKALRRTQDGEALAIEHRLAFTLNPDILRGGALVAQGSREEAVNAIRAGLIARGTIGWHMFQPYHLTVVSEVLHRAGDYDGATDALAEALAMIEASSERWWEAEIYRLKGVLLLSRREIADGEFSFKQAIRIARQQEAKSLELRAATSLARLWGEQGRRAEAHDLLASICCWFTEGFETGDLKEAAALIASLA
jgi:class 3 adenylate cyclase/predicted ATPase